MFADELKVIFETLKTKSDGIWFSIKTKRFLSTAGLKNQIGSLPYLPY